MMSAPGTPPTVKEDPPVAREASAALCRLLARLDVGELDAVDSKALAQQVATAMRAIYEARIPGSSAGRRSSLAAEAGKLIGTCLTSFRPSQTTEPEVKGVLALLVRATSALRRLQEDAQGELNRQMNRIGGILGASPSPAPPGVGPLRTTLSWSRGMAVIHNHRRSPILPPVEESTDEPGDSQDDDDAGSEDEDDLEALLNAPPMPLDELRALAAFILAQDDDVVELPEEAAEPVPLLVPPRRQATQVSDDLLALHIEDLAKDFRVRQAGSSSDMTWRELERDERLMVDRGDMIAWLGPRVVEPLARALLTAREPGLVFGAALPLLSIAGVDTADAVLRAAEAGRAGTIDDLVGALRFGPHPEAAARLPALLEKGAAPGARLIALRVLAERGGVDDAQLERMLVDPDPAIVAAAVSFILRSGKSYALARLEYMAEQPAEEPASSETIVAAAVLGSAGARERLRARVHGGDTSARLILGLAACGDERDVEPLVELALACGEETTTAIVALGWLGSAHAIAPLRELARDEEFGEEATLALTLLLGSSAADPNAKLGPGRWSAGQPWTARSPTSLLADEDSGALLRELAFLELVARTGQHVPFDPAWPVARQRAAAATWKATIEPLADRLAAHTWIYRGASS
jgi:hypothetical protein